MSINLYYLLFNLLLVGIIAIKLRKHKVTNKQKLIALGIYLLLTIISFAYMNGVMNSIFKLKYLNVKLYLLLLIGTNCIILYILNHPVKMIYKITSYIYFMMIMIMLGATLSIVLGNKFSNFYLMEIQNAIHFIDLSFITAMLYGMLIATIYITNYIIKEKIITKDKIKNIYNEIIDKVKSLNQKKTIYKPNILTPSELLDYNYDNGLYINGEDCSIIFEDSNKENIVKNYYILNNDIHATLMNGYTLEENKLFKSICMKLQVSNLGNIDIYNTNILNKINVEEYNLLKKLFGLN